MDVDTYNGWANRETWLVGLHLSNDKGLDDEAHAIVYAAQRDWTAPAFTEDFYAADADRVARAKVFAAGDALADYVRNELIPELGGEPGELLAGDLIGGALARVDWNAVAESFMSEGDES